MQYRIIITIACMLHVTSYPLHAADQEQQKRELIAATRSGDLALMRHMLNHGASRHSQTAISNAKHLPEAELLVEHGALTCEVKESILIDQSPVNHDPQLITYYKKLGANVTYQSESGYSVLMCLIHPIAHNTLEKIERFLENLSPKELTAILLMRDKHQKNNIFDHIEQERNEEMSDTDEYEGLIWLDDIQRYIQNLKKQIALPAHANDFLIDARSYPLGENFEHYRKRRIHMIDALEAGADIRSVQEQLKQEKKPINLLRQATQYGDCTLMKLMISRGADIHEPAYNTGNTPIFCAQNLPEVILLVSHNAHHHPHVQRNLLLHLSGARNPKLITYYRNLGLKPMYQDTTNGWSALMYAVRGSLRNNPVNRIERLLENLSPAEIRTLLAMRDDSKQDIFDHINVCRIDTSDPEDDRDPLDAIEQYLRAVEQDPLLPSKEEISCNTIPCL